MTEPLTTLGKPRRRRFGGGRHPQGPYELLTHTLTTRITEDLRKKLDAAADANGRSLAQEVSDRLYKSFEQPVFHPEWGPIVYA